MSHLQDRADKFAKQLVNKPPENNVPQPEQWAAFAKDYMGKIKDARQRVKVKRNAR